jgi:hypothetical protein
MTNSPAIARNIGRRPQDRRQTGVRKKTSGIPASMTKTYARNQRDPGSFMPRGANSKTRHAGHFGRNAKISDERDDDNTEVSAG